MTLNFGIFAPSSFVDAEDIQASTAILTSLNHNVEIHPQTYEKHRQSAGTPSQKKQAFHDLWDDSSLDVIWAAGGGNGCLHWIDSIEYAHLTSPKTLIGFSDVTALLNAVYAHKGYKSIHGPTFNKLHNHKNKENIIKCLECSPSPALEMSMAQTLQAGEAQGPLIGGNLSVFRDLPLTLPHNFWKGSILCLEDCNEELSKIDRMFLHLKRTGVLDDINGLILGEFKNLTDTGRPFGFSYEEIVQSHMNHLNIPIVSNAPFGHGENLLPFQIGQSAYLKAAQNNTITFGIE